MSETRTAVVLMAYGTPRTPDEILPYYTDIRRGHPPTDAQLADLTARYAAIGGISPLASRTEAQRDALQTALDRGRRRRLPRRAGPQARDTVHRAVRRGARRSGVPTHRRVGAGPALLGILDRSVPRSARRRCRRARHRRVTGSRVGRPNRHSSTSSRRTCGRRWRRCPTRPGCCSPPTRFPNGSSTAGDPYPSQLRSTAECVAAAVGLDDWGLAWQSAGRTPEPWLGPDILQVIDELAADGHTRAVAGQRRRLRQRSPRSSVRPRHRGPTTCHTSTAWPSPARHASTMMLR